MLNKQQIKQTLILGWPISLQNILVTLLSMIDVVMVSHLGDAAIGAVGLGNRVMFVVMVIILGLSWGVGILAAQYYGAGQTKKIRLNILIGSIYGIIALIPIIVLNIFYADSILALGTDNEEVISLGQSYLWITMPSVIFVAVTQVIENALRSINQVKLPLIFSVVSIILNVILNYWLINGGLGVDAMGVSGAALATTLSRLFQMLILLVILKHIKHELSVKRSDFALLGNMADWTKLLKLIAPIMLSSGVWSLGTFCYQLIYSRMGINELAVISMLLPVEALIVSLFFGIASACSIMVGQHLGANRKAEAWNTAKTFALLSPFVAIFVGLLLLLAQKYILMPYQGASAESLALANQAFVVITLLSWMKVINMTLAMGVLRAGGDNRYCLITDATAMWCVALPLTFLAAFYWQLAFVYVLLISYSEDLIKAFMFGIRVKNKRWMKNLT
ncbi:MATE family efflux transporter [Psychrosphaera saromensis]|uniref:Multidrug-efflux transporter n=1 Tax=Psychrosphaera saromensis TaxID=716813 RepID=A0A2S7UT80_9GAMM|nr:MATE family efflux transporter [Psychrosphaera saromensis]PQJ53184.1 MATE family efflux transporter [Psychrosphaera saromensis]GHB67351.1 MATE family efflux transporter [Psychrosphaera saromensis]GLQ15056.1 MATE family efflux transporter [Psychrosphaera saromensis]